MYTSVKWINDYLDPPADAAEQAELLTRAGFPLEETEEVPLPSGTDTRQDYEMTSNRGDAVSHLGLAREIAAISGRTLKVPNATPQNNGKLAAEVASVVNHEHKLCPLYTGRIIKGVNVGSSPDWLAERLTARGDIPRNNVVDATNFVLFEMGQPTHIFDLAKLKGSQIIVRMARDQERFLPIGEGESEVKLSAQDLVIADAEDAVAIAGVKGGAITAVTESTTDLLLEAASFDPVAVRNTSRRLGIASDSSYRFERGIHPGQVNQAADRLAELILELGGGELYEGVIYDGAPIPERRVASMRPERCRKILGVPITNEQMVDFLRLLGFEPTLKGEWLECVVPYNRIDIEREIDVIEEVGRMFGHDNIPVEDTIEIRVTPPQATELAKQAVADELVGLGFVETVTHSLVSDVDARPFFPDGRSELRVADERAKATPILQPSLIPSLLRVRKLNQDSGVEKLKLFESAATFQAAGADHHEVNTLGLLMDVLNPQDGLRPIRGVVERLVDVLLGHQPSVTIESDASTSWLTPSARVNVSGQEIGCLGQLSPKLVQQFGLDQPILAAELQLWSFYEAYPPETEAHALPSFPAIERDLSLIVAESITWDQMAQQVETLALENLDTQQFITTFRGKGIPSGHKSLSMRLRFRAPDRTLTHEEVDPQVEKVVGIMETQFAAQLRA